MTIVGDFKEVKRRLRGDDWWTTRADQALSQPPKSHPATIKRDYTPSPYDLTDDADGGASP